MGKSLRDDAGNQNGNDRYDQSKKMMMMMMMMMMMPLAADRHVKNIACTIFDSCLFCSTNAEI
jgi:hypothetical protein